MEKTHILFVCLGNICRSPMAEGLFIHLIEQGHNASQFVVDSAGTAGFHIGSKPDSRMVETAKSHEVSLPSLARQFVQADFANFDFIIAMDESNVENMEKLPPQTNTRAQVLKMRDFDEIDKGGDVPDPYYGGLNGFENVYQILLNCNNRFIDYLEKTK